MKTLGLIGGLSWESTALYYKIINTEVKHALGGLHSARMLIYSFDFEEIAALQKAGQWEQATHRMIEAGNALKSAGADALVICTNTMHKMAAEVEAQTQLPLIHIADCAGQELKSHGLSNVGLLGTQFTMEQPFLKEHLQKKFGINVLIPDEEDRLLVHKVIFEELCRGQLKDVSRAKYEEIILRLKGKGAQAVVLGCTEIVLLLHEQEHGTMKLFDTTAIHARYAAKYALNG